MLAIACAGLSGFHALGNGLGANIAGSGRGSERHSAASLVSTQAAGLVTAARKVTATERLALWSDPIRPYLAAFSDPEWREAAIYSFTRRLTDGREPGLDRPNFGGETPLFLEGTLESLGLPFDRRSDPRPLPWKDPKTFATLVDDETIHLLVRARGSFRVTDTGDAFSIRDGALTLNRGHRLAKNRRAFAQVVDNFAVHLLERAGANVEAAYAFFDWRRATEALQQLGEERVALEKNIEHFTILEEHAINHVRSARSEDALLRQSPDDTPQEAAARAKKIEVLEKGNESYLPRFREGFDENQRALDALEAQLPGLMQKQDAAIAAFEKNVPAELRESAVLPAL